VSPSKSPEAIAMPNELWTPTTPGTAGLSSVKNCDPTRLRPLEFA